MTDSVYHVHKDLGYMVFVLLSLQFFLIGIGAWKKPVFRRAIDFLQTLAIRVGGPLLIFAGFYLWHRMKYPLGTLWIWLALFLWIPVEMAGKRMIRPALEDSESHLNSSRLLMGAALQWVLVCAIVVLMRTKAVGTG